MTTDNMRNECVKKKQKCAGWDTAFITRKRKLNGDEGYQTVPARPFGKCKMQTSWNLGYWSGWGDGMWNVLGTQQKKYVGVS